MFINSDYQKGGSPSSFETISEDDLGIYTLNTIHEFKNKLNKLGILNWKESYVNPNMMDGCQWKLTITYNDGKIKYIKGSDAYPNNFDRVENLLFDVKNE